MTGNIDRGDEAEDLVEQICHKMFLEDFTVRNPKFLKSGAEKEAADFLVPFGNTLLAFQVKSKTETKSAFEKEEKDFNRIENKISLGVDQLKTIKRALRSGHLKTITNGAGITLPFEGNRNTNLIGLVILELFGEEQFGDDERTAIYNGYIYRNDIPTHIFTRQVFDTISSEIDTIPDLISYLTARQEFYEKEALSPATHELDFLTLFKTQPEAIEKVLKGKLDLVVITDDLWKGYRNEHIDLISERDSRNRPSLLIDEVIKWLHTSIGYNPGTNDPTGRSESSEGTVEKYYATIFELAAIPRLLRRMVGTKFLEKLVKADKVGDGHSVVQISSDTGVLVLATDRLREERTRGMYNLAAVAYCGLNLKKIIVIATEPLTVKQRSYDVMVLSDVIFENHDELASKLTEMFGPMKHGTITEY
jgi:predicted nicotinamide N-methyase